MQYWLLWAYKYHDCFILSSKDWFCFHALSMKHGPRLNLSNHFKMWYLLTKQNCNRCEGRRGFQFQKCLCKLHFYKMVLTWLNVKMTYDKTQDTIFFKSIWGVPESSFITWDLIHNLTSLNFDRSLQGSLSALIDF